MKYVQAVIRINDTKHCDVITVISKRYIEEVIISLTQDQSHHAS